MLRDRLYSLPRAPTEPEAEDGFDLDRQVLRAGQVARVAGRARAGRDPGRRGGGRQFGRGTGRADRDRGGAPRTAPAAWFDPAALDPDDEAAVAAWFADPDAAEGAARRQAGAARAGRPRLALAGVGSDTALAAYLARPDQRSYDLADLALRYLQRELRADGVDDRRSSTLDGLATTASSRAGADAAGPGHARPGRRARPRSCAGDGRPPAAADVELPLVEVLADMERAGIAADTDYLSELEAHFAAEVKAAAQAAYAVIGREFNLGSPKQLQEVLFDELGLPKTKRIKTGYTTDADALAGPVRADRAPVPGAPAAAPRRRPAQDDRRRAAQVGQRRRPDPHHLPADGGGHRPAVQHRPQPAEHPDPHRGGPADPPGVHRRRRATRRC